MGYILQKQWEIYAKHYGYIMGYIRQKLRHTFDKNYGIYSAKTKGYIGLRL